MAASILSRSSGLHGTDGGLGAVSGSHGRGFNASRAAHAFKMGVYGALVVTAKKVSAKGSDLATLIRIQQLRRAAAVAVAPALPAAQRVTLYDTGGTVVPPMLASCPNRQQ
jgi:hypothetical protein